MAERTQSPAYGALRASSRRLLLFIEGEIARAGGGSVTIYADQFAVVGSIRVVLPGLSELHALGLIDVERSQKRHVAVSERWRDVATKFRSVAMTRCIRARPRRPRGWRARGSERKLSKPACKKAGYSGRTPRCQLDVSSDYQSQPRPFSVRACSALRMPSHS
jgi:hypothetical protein